LQEQGFDVRAVRPPTVPLLAPVFVLAATAACADTTGPVLSSLARDGATADSNAPTDAAGDGAGNLDAAPDCAADGLCPLPGPGQITVCGRVLDATTTDVPGEIDRLVVNITDPAEILGGDLATVTPDACGWFVAEDIFYPIPGYIVVVTDEQSGADDYRTVVSLQPSSPGQVIRTHVYALSTAADTAWTAAAGLAESFASAGSFLGIFVDTSKTPVGRLPGQPVAGVTLTRAGMPQPAADIYFADANPLTRQTIAGGQATTGVNGSGLLHSVAPALGYSGEKASCSFAAFTGGAIPGTIQVQEVFGACP
jgi:hypothetical protein